MKIREADETAKIRQAYANAVPDICDVILSDCKIEKGQVIMMEETRKKKSTVKYVLAAAACLLLVFGGGFGLSTYQFNHRVASTVSLEVNPSLQIMVNGKDRVLEVKALNQDGEIVIGDMDFSGSDINVAVNALIGSMLRNGYLNELANSILISVDNEDPEKGAALQGKLTEEVNKVLESGGLPGAVLSQTLTEKSTLQKEADQYGITPGKAQLIEQILESKQGHTFEELAPLSINELNLLITTTEAEMTKVSAMGNASDKAYIGEQKAKQIAFGHAGISEADIAFYEVDMDLEKGVMVYEIEFYCGGYEYEYDIDALAGTIVKNKKEIDENHHHSEVNAGNSSGTGNKGNAGNSSGTGNKGNAGNSSGTGNNANTENSGNTSVSITLDQAKEIALNHAGQTADAVYFKKAKQDYDDGLLIYEIEFIAGSTEYEYEINAQTGDIVKNKTEAADTPHSGNTGNNGNARNTSASITLDQAKEIALTHAGQTADAVYFKKAKQDYDDGLLIYEIEFIAGSTEYEYEINAQTGDIVKNKTEAADTPHSGNTGNNGNAGNTSASITLDQVKEIALTHAGQTADAVWFEKAEQDYDDGILVYELEFAAKGTEYEYEIDAQTGAIREYKWDDD